MQTAKRPANKSTHFSGRRSPEKQAAVRIEHDLQRATDRMMIRVVRVPASKSADHDVQVAGSQLAGAGGTTAGHRQPIPVAALRRQLAQLKHTHPKLERRVHRAALELYGGDIVSAAAWLVMRQPALSGRAPIECISTESGVVAVERFASQLAHGVYV